MTGSASKSLAGTAADEILKIGRWKTERVRSAVLHRVDHEDMAAGVQEKTGPRRERVDTVPFVSDFSACAPKYG